MSITKSEAIVQLAISAGNADGEFSFEEISAALTKTPAFNEVFKDAESTDWASKVRLGELTTESALKVLNHLSPEDKTEAMAICWGIVMSDGILHNEEKELMEKWTEKLGIRVEDVKEKYKQLSA